MLQLIHESYVLAAWAGLVIVAAARLSAAGVEANSRWIGVRGQRAWLGHLVDSSPNAVRRNRQRVRSRLYQLLGALLLGVPASLGLSLGGRADPTLTTAAVAAVALSAGGYLIWRLHRFEVEGRARYRAQLFAEGTQNLRSLGE